MPSLATCAFLLLAFLEPQAPPDGPRAAGKEPAPDALGIQATQLTVRLGKEQFRATVVAKEGQTLTLVTAAHCVTDRDSGSPLLVRHGNTVLRGQVMAAAQNPDYRPVPSRNPESRAVRGVLSVDNAVARIRLTPTTDAERQALREITTAEFAPTPVLGAVSRIITVHIIDQQGREHVVTAGNHLNPKCLAWGNASFHPHPGDSGAGVFFVRETTEGKPRPLLVGNVALSDDRGGIAPLLSRSTKWLEEALAKVSVDKPL